MTRRKTPHPPGNPEDWLHYAKGDLNLALVAKGRRGILPEQVCFHAQQAREKALKAVLVLNDIEFPLVHDIEALLDIARQGGVALPPEAFLSVEGMGGHRWKGGAHEDVAGACGD